MDGSNYDLAGADGGLSNKIGKVEREKGGGELQYWKETCKKLYELNNDLKYEQSIQRKRIEDLEARAPFQQIQRKRIEDLEALVKIWKSKYEEATTQSRKNDESWKGKYKNVKAYAQSLNEAWRSKYEEAKGHVLQLDIMQGKELDAMQDAMQEKKKQRQKMQELFVQMALPGEGESLAPEEEQPLPPEGATASVALATASASSAFHVRELARVEQQIVQAQLSQQPSGHFATSATLEKDSIPAQNQQDCPSASGSVESSKMLPNCSKCRCPLNLKPVGSEAVGSPGDAAVETPPAYPSARRIGLRMNIEGVFGRANSAFCNQCLYQEAVAVNTRQDTLQNRPRQKNVRYQGYYIGDKGLQNNSCCSEEEPATEEFGEDTDSCPEEEQEEQHDEDDIEQKRLKDVQNMLQTFEVCSTTEDYKTWFQSLIVKSFLQEFDGYKGWWSVTLSNCRTDRDENIYDGFFGDDTQHPPCWFEAEANYGQVYKYLYTPGALKEKLSDCVDHWKTRLRKPCDDGTAESWDEINNNFEVFADASCLETLPLLHKGQKIIFKWDIGWWRGAIYGKISNLKNNKKTRQGKKKRRITTSVHCHPQSLTGGGEATSGHHHQHVDTYSDKPCPNYWVRFVGEKHKLYELELGTHNYNGKLGAPVGSWALLAQKNKNVTADEPQHNFSI